MSKKSGFSLVELMVAMVIIVILGTVAMVSYSRYAKKANMAEAYNGLDILSKNMTAYYAENKHFLFLAQNPGHTLYCDPATLVMCQRMWSQPEMTATGWDRFPLIFPKTQLLKFSYGAVNGRTNGSGTEQQSDTDTSSTGGNWLQPVAQAQIGAYRNIPTATHQYPCTQISASDYITAAGKIHYSWAMLSAGRDFNVTEANHNCTTLIKVIDTDAKGTVRASHPIVTLYEGE